MAVGRQGNLIVRSTKTVPDSQLRQKLIEEIKKQKKSYGLYFEDIAGGFTLTLRNMPQAFQIMPLMVWKVYPDGRPDELKLVRPAVRINFPHHQWHDLKSLRHVAQSQRESAGDILEVEAIGLFLLLDFFNQLLAQLGIRYGLGGANNQVSLPAHRH